MSTFYSPSFFSGHPVVVRTTIVNVYQVSWEPSPVKWASRWDVYLEMSDTQIHWFSIINSVVVVFFLSGIITMIIIRYDNEVIDCNCEL